MILTIMTTGRDPSYIHQTLASVLASDWNGAITVSADPTGTEPVRQLLHHQRVRLSEWSTEDWLKVKDSRVHRRAGAHYCKCLDMLAKNPAGGVVLEDDVVVRDDLQAALGTMVVDAWKQYPDGIFAIAIYSTYGANPGDAMEEMAPGMFFGTQGMYWSRRAAERILPYLREHAVERDESVYDILIARHARGADGVALLKPAESLVQHVGAETTGMGSFHRSRTFMANEKSGNDVAILTAGIGDRWPELAMRVASRMKELHPNAWVEAITKVPSWIPGELPSPHWLKAFLWDIVPPWCETLVWVDADVIPMRSLMSPLPGPFAAVPDADASMAHARHGMPMLIQTLPYFNTGVFSAPRDSTPLFEILKQLMYAGVSFPSSTFYEQSWINLLIQMLSIKVEQLDRRFNWMPAFGTPPETVRIIHPAGGHSWIDRTWEASDALFYGGNSAPQHLKGSYRRTARVYPAAGRCRLRSLLSSVRVYPGHGDLVKPPPV